MKWCADCGVLQLRPDVFLLEPGRGGETTVHPDVRSTAGILHVAVEIRVAVAHTRPPISIAIFDRDCAHEQR